MTLPAISKPRFRVRRDGVAYPAPAMGISTAPEVETAHHAASLGAKDMASWNPYRVSPDTALLGELDTIVARSDDLARNNGIAAGSERTLVDNVVGPRLLCKPNPDRIAIGRDADWADQWSREVESLWASFADTVWFDAAQKLTFHGSTRLAFRSVASSGEALALPLWLSNRGSRWKTTIQLVDPARLSNPNGRADTVNLRGGIELDFYGAPVAYHIRKSHPGDIFGTFFAPSEWERVPALTPWGRLRVIHAFEGERIGQNRGKPIVTSVARIFKMYDHLMREKLRLAVMDSMIFAALETPLDQESIVQMFGGEGSDYKTVSSSVQGALNEWRVQMRGGAMIPLPPGTKMNPFAPARGASELDAFATLMLRNIATGLNMPYELVFRDFSKTNYSSARAALLEAWRYFAACRQFLADGWSSPIYELWFEEAVNRGEIPDCTPDDFYSKRIAWTRCKWIGAGRGWVDPLKEAQAAGERMRNDISTLEDECAEQGKDWREVQEQRAREQRSAKALGLQPTPAPNMQQQQQPSANNADQPEEAIPA